MIAYDIKWNVDIDEAIEKLESMSVRDAARVLQYRPDLYANMIPEDRRDLAREYFRHCPGALEDFVGLPNEVEIPSELTEDEDISNWLSDTYGYCHEGFSTKASPEPAKYPVRGEVISDFNALRDIDPGTFNFR